MEEFEGEAKPQDGSKDELDVIEEDPEEGELMMRSRVFSRSNTNKASASENENLENSKNKADPSDSENDAQSIRSFGSGFSRNKAINLHTKSKAQSLRDPVKGESDSKKDIPISILTWPKECGERTLYVIFFPFYVIYWAIMPNLLYKPRISKVLMGIVLGFLFFIAFAAILTFLQEDLIFNFKIKPNLFSIFNSLIYNISYPHLT